MLLLLFNQGHSQRNFCVTCNRFTATGGIIVALVPLYGPEWTLVDVAGMWLWLSFDSTWDTSLL